MFVVRIDREDEAPDFKAFSKRPDAEKRFGIASRKVWEKEFEAAALFEVLQTEDARSAVEAVKSGDKSIVRLLEKEPQDLDLSSLDFSGLT